MLEERVEHVEAEPIHAPREPAADHLELRGFDRRVAPVVLWLLRQERVVVELLSGGLPLPARPTEE